MYCWRETSLLLCEKRNKDLRDFCMSLSFAREVNSVMLKWHEFVDLMEGDRCIENMSGETSWITATCKAKMELEGKD
jgi:hypothetical protein